MHRGGAKPLAPNFCGVGGGPWAAAAETGKLLGAHIVGAKVTELIQGYVIAMNCETTEEELMHTVFPHPT